MRIHDKHTLFEMPDIGVVLVSPQGAILEANETACNYWGYSAEEIKSLTVKDLTHPEDLEKSLRYYSGGTVSPSGSFSYEKRYLGKDGKILWGRVSVIWLQDEQGDAAQGLALVQDITDRQTAHEKVTTERTFLQSIVDGIADPIKVVGLDHRILTMNRAARELVPPDSCGKASQCCRQASKQYYLPCLAGSDGCNLEKVRQSGQPVRTLHRHRQASGEEAVFEIMAVPLNDGEGGLAGVIETFRNVTELIKAEAEIKEKEKRLAYATHYDLVTTLPNQTLLLDRLTQTLARARRFSDKFAVLLLKLNRLKHINDSLGHQAGDALLREVARRLKGHVRGADTLARLRGNEFVVVLEKAGDVNRIVEVAQRLLQDVTQEVRLEEVAVHITASVGISRYPEDADNADDLLRCADAAQRRAREEAGNTYQFYSAGMTRQSRERLELESQLHRALKEEQLEVYYQPQIDLAAGHCIGCEALVRWRHPQRGLVSPGDFIPLAEETGLIEPMGLWVLKAACLWKRCLQGKGGNSITVSVNISARQLYSRDFSGTVQRILQETGLEPRFLELEITESMLMKNQEAAIAVMRDLSRLGISIAMDDFGTGYSSLSYLHKFPINKLKIDRSFVTDLIGDASAKAIARSVIALAGNLNLRVIAEGVEYRDQASLLKEMGCHEVQGFLFSKPLPASEAERFFAGQRAEVGFSPVMESPVTL